MSEAGVTNGAFYPHFASNGALVREALASALADQQHRLDEDQRRGLDLEGAIRRYLHRAHLEDPASGCPSAVLLPEIAGQPLPTRQVLEGGLRLRCTWRERLLPKLGAVVRSAALVRAVQPTAYLR